MKKMLGFLARPIVFSTLGLALLLAALWLICGLLSLDEQAWLVELLVGTPLTLFLLIYWGTKFLAERRRSNTLAPSRRQPPPAGGSDGVQNFAALEEEWQRAFRTIEEAAKKRGLSGGGKSLPWLLVLGSPAAGKTTALDRSGLRLLKERRTQGIFPTQSCTFFLASDAVFLDTAGRYAAREDEKQEWVALLRFLKRRRRQPLDAVVLTIGCDELLARPPAEIEKNAGLLRQRIDELTHILGVEVPIHIMVNKVDLLDGFAEFFGELPESERDRAWGFSLDIAGPNALPGQSLVALLDAKLDQLVAALMRRQTERLLVQKTRAGREAVLGFPSEFAALRTPLFRYLEALRDGNPGHEPPRLAAVYFTSAVQTGERRPSWRARLFAELALGATTTHAAPPLSEGSFFLRGLFSQAIRQAERAVRPSVGRLQRLKLEQRLAVCVSMLACAGACFILSGRYLADRQWLEQLEAAVAELNAGALPGGAAHEADDRKLLRELSTEQALLDLLEEKPHGALGRPHRVAREILLKRLDAAWLLPLRAELEQDLKAASATLYDKPGAAFDRGFQLLKAAHIIDGQACEKVSQEELKQAISDFLLAEWRRALGRDRHLLDVREEPDPQRPRSPVGQLQRGLLFFFSAEPEVYAKLNSLHLDQKLRNEARDNLRSADAPAAVVFMLRASNANLYTKTPQLRAAHLGDPGIEQVFTRAGCGRFFDKKTESGKHFWKCVLGVEEPKDPVNLEEEYRQNYLEAWGGWLKGLSLKPMEGEKGNAAQADALKRAGDTLDGLLRPPRPELLQLVETVGIGREDSPVPKSLRHVRQTGCVGWLRKQAVRVKQEVRDIETPQACKQAFSAFEPFFALRAKPTQDAADEDTGPVASELMQKYLSAAGALRTSLYNIRNVALNNRGKQALKLVADTMGGAGELWALDEARRSLIHELDGRMGASHIAVENSGFHTILLEVERDAWAALLPMAARSIDDRYKVEVLEPWSQLKNKHKRYTAQDPERVKDIVDFAKTVKDFSKQVLVPFYQNGDASRCMLTTMPAPFADAVPLARASCELVQKFIRVAEVTDPNKALGSAGSAAKRPPLNADVAMPSSCRGYNARAVALDDGENLHTCYMHSTKCQHEQSMSKRPSLSVSWGESSAFKSYLRGDDYSLFIKNPGNVDGNRLTFSLPAQEAPGQCSGIKVTFELQPAQGGGGAPNKPDTAWKDLDLPPSLLR